VRKLGQLPRDLPRFGDQAGEPGEFVALGRILAATYQGSRARSSAFWVGNETGNGNYYDMQGRPLRKSFLKSPLNYRRISSGFSRARRHPVTKRVVPHHGVDYVAAPGTPVSATADGRVISAGWDGPLGKAVRIRHGSEYVTIYGHLRGIAKGIHNGADVRQNQVIGYVGSTGRTTGPHLHYTLQHRGSPINPLKFKSPSADPLPPEMKPQLEIAKRKWLPLLDAIRPDELELQEGSGLVDVSLRDAPIRSEMDVIVVGIRRSSQGLIFNPPSDMAPQAGDVLVALGRLENLQKLERLATKKR